MSFAPAFDWQALKATSRGTDDLVGGLDDTLDALRARRASEELLLRGAALQRARDAFDTRVIALDGQEGSGKSHELATLSGGYVWLVAGASALHFVAARQASSTSEPLAEALCSLVLRRVLRELSPGEHLTLESDRAREAQLDEALVSMCEQQRMFSLCEVRLARQAGGADP